MKSIFFDDDIKKDINEEDNKKQEIKKVTKEELLSDLYKKATKQSKIKKSIFLEIDKNILKNISQKITLKEMSYRSALEKLKEIYPKNDNLQQIKRSESLRYFLIKHNYITNEKALKTINKSISNSVYAKNKRERIIKDVIEEILEKHLETLISHPKFKEAIKNIIKEEQK